jgi:hypothetical protein
MEKNKGLADTQEGEFILNETGTSVSTDQVEGLDTPAPATDEPGDKGDEKKDSQAETT